MGPIAQLVRAPDEYSGSPVFESQWVHRGRVGVAMPSPGVALSLRIYFLRVSFTQVLAVNSSEISPTGVPPL